MMRRLACDLPKTILVSLSVLLILQLGAGTARADERGGARRSTPVKLRPSSTQQGPAGVPRQLLPPAGLGSAANVAPGFYRQLDAPRRPHGGGAPGVVYVVPPAVYGTPIYTPIHGTVGSPYEVGPVEVGVEPVPRHQERRVPEPVEQPAAPQPPPIVIVNQLPPSAAAPAAPPAPPAAVVARPPARPLEPRQVLFSVMPADAEVYLDSDPLGSGEQLAALAEPLSLDPGVYVVEVVHPEHDSQRIVFGVGSKPVEIIVDLAAEAPRRRSRVRQ